MRVHASRGMKVVAAILAFESVICSATLEHAKSTTFKPRMLFYHSLNLTKEEQGLNLAAITQEDVIAYATGDNGPTGFTVRSHGKRKDSERLMIQGDVDHGYTSHYATLNDEGDIEPDVTDKESVVNLAKMTSNAYILDPTQPDWLNLSLGFNVTDRFGWEGDGLRGQIFSTEDNSTVVVSFKGTSVDPRDPWRNNDRLNDNRLFSCCCGAQNPWRYAPVCDCLTDLYTCNSTCVTQSILAPDVYYTASLDVMHNISALFPNSTFWAVGHSLGGSLASLVGLTLDIPAVAFEAPPEKLPAERLGLLKPHRRTTYHFGNTGDPIFMGACNGFFSSCSAFGFTFDSQCFAGKRCVYDTVVDKGWHLSITNHRINYVIENVLEAYDTVPKCTTDDECVDCFNWKFTSDNS